MPNLGRPIPIANPLQDLATVLRKVVQKLKDRARAKAWSQKNRVKLNVRAQMRRLRDPVAARAREQAKRDRRRPQIRARLASWRAERRVLRATDPEMDERLRRQNTEASRRRQREKPEAVRAARKDYYRRNRKHIIKMQVARTRRWREKRKERLLNAQKQAAMEAMLQTRETAADALRRVEIAKGVAEQVKLRQRLAEIEETQLAQLLAG